MSRLPSSRTRFFFPFTLTILIGTRHDRPWTRRSSIAGKVDVITGSTKSTPPSPNLTTARPSSSSTTVQTSVHKEMATILAQHDLVDRQFRTIVPGLGPEPEALRSTITRTTTITQSVASTLATFFHPSPSSSPSPNTLVLPSAPFPSPSFDAYMSSPTTIVNLVAYEQTSPSTLDPALDPNLPHTDLGPLLNAVFWTLTILALIFLLLRLHVKLSRASISLWWDDYVLILSWIALLISASTTSACVALNYGKHLYDIDPANLPLMPFIAVFAGFFSVLAAAWSKTSFALTLLRLAASSESSNGNRNYMKYLIWFIIITVNLILGVAMLTMWVKCWPIAKIWDGSITDGWCIDPRDIIILYQWSAGWSGAMDIVLALCPWVLLWKLTMTRREKIGVGVAMSMGVVAGVASFVKMGMLPKLDGDPVDTVAVTIWGGAEGAITIMAASIPVLRTLFQRRKDFTPLELPASPGRGPPGMRERDPMATYASDLQGYVHRVIPAAQVARIKSGQEKQRSPVLLSRVS